MPVVLEKACCCLELGMGTIIIGCFYVFCSLFNIIKSITLMAQPEMDIGTAIVMLLMGMFQLIISGLMIRGGMTRNRRLVLPWLIVTIINLVIINIVLLMAAFAIPAATLTVLMVLVIVDLLVGYLWAIVYSFYHVLEANPGFGVL